MPAHCYSSVTVRRGTLESLNVGVWLRCMEFLLLDMLCFSAIFSSSNAFMIFFPLFFLFWLFSSGLLGFYIPPHTEKKRMRNKEKTNPSKLQRLQTINVKFHYPELQAELLVLLSLYSCHIYIVLSFDFLHPNPFAPRNKLFSVLCAGESCLIVGLPFWRFSAPRKYDTYPLMHHL